MYLWRRGGWRVLAFIGQPAGRSGHRLGWIAEERPGQIGGDQVVGCIEINVSENDHCRIFGSVISIAEGPRVLDCDRIQALMSASDRPRIRVTRWKDRALEPAD